jgi:hypothetical protein
MTLYSQLKEKPTFFSDVYSYFTRGGYICILAENILQIFIIAFTLIFVTFTCFFLNWDAIGHCESEETCENMSSYIISPLSFHTTGITTCMFLFISVFIVYWTWISVALINDIFKFAHFKKYFSNNLSIKEKQLKVLPWDDIVKRMIEYDNELTTEMIIGSIMRKENYLISIISSNIFNINPMYYTNSFLWLFI